MPDLAIYADTVRVFLITKLQKKLYEGELAQQKHQFLVFYLPPTQIRLCALETELFKSAARFENATLVF